MKQDPNEPRADISSGEAGGEHMHDLRHSLSAMEDGLACCLSSSDLPVERVIRADILKCAPDVPLREAARRMHEARCGSILVMEDGRMCGIWTGRDALEVDAADPASFDVPIRSVMTSPVKTVLCGTSLEAVSARFREEDLRHLLVVDEGGVPRGVVSQTDVVLNGGIEHYLRLNNVESVVRGAPPMVASQESMADATVLMRRLGADAVVVEYHDDSLGILTERDVIRFIAASQGDQGVGTVASRPLLVVPVGTSLFQVRTAFLKTGVRHMGVAARNGELTGLISVSDILSGMDFAYVEELRRVLLERDHARNQSHRHLQLAEKVIENSLEGVVITDRDQVIQSVNPAFTKLTGYMPEDVIGETPQFLSSGRHDKAFYEKMWASLNKDGHWQGEIWNRRKNGEVYPELLTITAITDENGELTHYAGIFSDISELKENEQYIKHLAYYDPLTGLPNRRLLNDRLSVAIAHSRRSQRRVALMFVDLDRFKQVNDTLGHAIGDELLRQVARRLRACVREDDTVARTGGDEFIIMLSDIKEAEDAAHIARWVLDTMKEPVVIQDQELVVTCSIGISFYPDDGESEAVLVKNADAAMYRAKDTGRNSFQLYTAAMNARSLQHLAMETALRKALERNEFTLHLQPVVDADSGELVEAEALLRWRHPDVGLLAPADFLPLAEDTGLMVPIGEWVLRAVCTQLRAWRQQGWRDVPVALNIAACQFWQEGFISGIERILGEYGVAPSSLIFELKENLLMEDAVETIHRLDAIHALGIEIAVDDFGTGYSSLNNLKRFPIGKLKIDRTFIRDLLASGGDEAIVASVINLAHSLGTKVVAEGVENGAQLAALRRHGCDLMQGFYFSEPLSLEEFEQRYLNGTRAAGTVKIN